MYGASPGGLRRRTRSTGRRAFMASIRAIPGAPALPRVTIRSTGGVDCARGGARTPGGGLLNPETLAVLERRVIPTARKMLPFPAGVKRPRSMATSPQEQRTLRPPGNDQGPARRLVY